MTILTACSGQRPALEIKTSTAEVARIGIVNPPKPTPPSLTELGAWKVVTPLDIADTIRSTDPSLSASLIAYYAKYPAAAFTLYAVTPDQYAIIIDNQTETLRYVRDANAVIDYYRGLDLK